MRSEGVRMLRIIYEAIALGFILGVTLTHLLYQLS